MQSEDFLRNDFSAVTKDTLRLDCLEIMKQYTINHIPVVEESLFLGIFSDEILETSTADTLEEIMYEMDFFSIEKKNHWQEVIEVFGSYDTNIVPVLDAKRNYLGYYILADFISVLAKTPFFTENGSFLLVEKDIDNFSFSEISQIVESNQGKIWGVFISDLKTDKVQVTLKVNLSSLTSLLQTFRRYGYDILLQKEDDIYLKDLKEKSEYLEKYLTL